MKNIFILAIIAVLFTITACKKFIDVNDNPNVPTDVNEALILSPVELDIAHAVSSGFDFAVVNHWLQNVSLNQPIPNTGTYLLYNVNVDADWANLYTTCLNNLQALIKRAETAGNSKYAGIAQILSAFSLGVATDLWGDVPYS